MASSTWAPILFGLEIALDSCTLIAIAIATVTITITIAPVQGPCPCSLYLGHCQSRWYQGRPKDAATRIGGSYSCSGTAEQTWPRHIDYKVRHRQLLPPPHPISISTPSPSRLFNCRLGHKQVASRLLALIAAVRNAGLRVIWVCDPMHGNTHLTENGIKTRSFDSIMAELEQTFAIHASAGSTLNGVHFELTGENVTECVGGPQVRDTDGSCCRPIPIPVLITITITIPSPIPWSTRSFRT